MSFESIDCRPLEQLFAEGSTVEGRVGASRPSGTGSSVQLHTSMPLPLPPPQGQGWVPPSAMDGAAWCGPGSGGGSGGTHPNSAEAARMPLCGPELAAAACAALSRSAAMAAAADVRGSLVRSACGVPALPGHAASVAAQAGWGLQGQANACGSDAGSHEQWGALVGGPWCWCPMSSGVAWWMGPGVGVLRAVGCLGGWAQVSVVCRALERAHAEPSWRLCRRLGVRAWRGVVLRSAAWWGSVCTAHEAGRRQDEPGGRAWGGWLHAAVALGRAALSCMGAACGNR